MRSFVRYWPVLCAAYDVYLNHPRADEGEGRRLCLERDCVQASPLNETEAGEVFERVWERIRGGQGRRANRAGEAFALLRARIHAVPAAFRRLRPGSVAARLCGRGGRLCSAAIEHPAVPTCPPACS